MPRLVTTFFFMVVAPVMAQMPMNMGSAAGSFKENVLRHEGAGTDLDPASGARPMLMTMRPGGWMLMLHGEAGLAEQQQTGPRGRDKLFSANWLMPMAQRSYGRGELTLRTMLSLEPATITGRYYPELFQEGETAFGKPIVDGQHPHNLFMELAGIYDFQLASHALVTFYGGPVGDPALGPEAFPHRPSAGDNPLAPLGHHLEDSTHIAWDVVTAGLSVDRGQRGVRVEASRFHGREPDENRWHIEVGAMDSWAARLTIAASKDFTAQYSVGYLHSPEQVHPEGNVLRETASVSYRHAIAGTSVDAIAVWGRNHFGGSPIDASGYLLEATLHDRQQQTAWTRIENVDRTTDLLGASAPPIESVIGRVQAYTGGYAHRLWECENGSVELGAQVTGYGVPNRLTQLYGEHPVGAAAVLSMHLGK